MRLLITGANGQVGREIIHYASKMGFAIASFDHAQMDITDIKQLEHHFKNFRPDFTINTAAYTAVDKAENESALAFAINRDGVKHLAQICQKHTIPLLHLSTDYVFDGTKTIPYDEQDHAHPINIYGQSKWAGEEMLRAHWEQHIILRTSWVFGAHGHNFVKTMLRLGCEREELKVVADQIGCPTSASDIAKTLLTITKKILTGQTAWGTYHYCGDIPVSWYEFANIIFQLAKPNFPLRINHVLPITTADYPTPAQRPKNSVLNTAKLKNIFEISACDWQAGLRDVLKKLEQSL
jgi:dTDP-4-dehydrorhamnose reductase